MWLRREYSLMVGLQKTYKKMKLIRVISKQSFIFVLLIMLILGAIFLTPNIFTSKFYTFSALWTITGIVNITIMSLILCKNAMIEFSVIILLAIAGMFILLFSYNAIYGVSGILLLFSALCFIVKNLNINHNCFYACLTVVVLLLSLYALYQYLFIPKHNTFLIIGSFDNPAGFAACISMLFPYVLFVEYKKTCQERFWKGTITIVCITSVILSQSRTGIIGLCSTLLLWTLNKNRDDFVLLKKYKWFKGLIFSFILLFLMVILLYFFKSDSTKGRLFIGRISLSLLLDAPFWGSGANTFMAKYMSSQADYFALNPDSAFSLLADNTRHPMNEYLLILIEYGVCGFVLLGISIIFLRNSYLSSKSYNKTPALYSLISLLLVSMFSYPMKYPIIWILTGIAIAIIIDGGSKECKMHPIIKIMIAILIIIFVLTPICQRWIDERRWFKIANINPSGSNFEVICEYEDLYKRMKDVSFLYNYAAELSMAQEYKYSNKILEECTNYINDTDAQLLMAENHQQLREYDKAIECLLFAHNMCPNRFIPLYRLMVLYIESDKRSDARNVAKMIVNKQIKISSSTICLIIKEAQLFLDQNDTINLKKLEP